MDQGNGFDLHIPWPAILAGQWWIIWPTGIPASESPISGCCLFFYRDGKGDGTGDVANASIIGRGAWDAFDFLFSEGNGAIYAVDQPGNLIFYRDNKQDGTGEVANGSVIGRGGWNQFKALFSGGNGVIYAVDQLGNLIFYRDNKQDGTGEVANGSVIGRGGWNQFKALFSGGNGAIYGTLLLT